jgi:hypothetical protein
MNPSSSPRRWPFIVAFIVFIVLVESSYLIWTRSHDSHGHAHNHAEHDTPSLTLNGTQRWETDEALRLGMQRIRDALARQDPSANQPALPPDQTKALADTVRENVTYLIRNCRLELKADANLHVIINELMAGAALLATDGQSAEGLAKLRHALSEYPRYFNHPNWHPLSAAMP